MEHNREHEMMDTMEERRTYNAPRLVSYGDLTTITQTLDDWDISVSCWSYFH